MKKPKLFGWAFVLAFALTYVAAACGGGLESCPGDGVICTNCAASGDCDIQCGAGEQEFCGHFGFFEDPNQRCAFCDSRDDPFARKLPLAP